MNALFGMHTAELCRFQDLFLGSGENFVRLRAAMFAQGRECFFATLIANEIRHVLKQHELERIGCNQGLRLTVMFAETRNDFVKAWHDACHRERPQATSFGTSLISARIFPSESLKSASQRS